MNIRRMLSSDKAFGELLRGSFVVLITRVIALLLGLATTVIVARWFGPAATGLVALLNSIALVFGTLSAFGLGSLLMRDISAEDSSLESTQRRQYFLKALWTVLLIASALLVPTLALIYFRLPDFASQMPTLSLLAAVVLLLGRALTNYMEKISRAVGDVHIYAFFLFLPVSINFLGVSVVGLIGDKFLLAPSVVLAFSVGISALFLLFYLSRRLINRDMRSNWQSNDDAQLPTKKMLLRKGFPFAVSAVLGILVVEGNLVVAGFLLPIEQVGIYSIAHKISLLAAFVLTSVNMVAAPRFSKLYASGSMGSLRDYSRRVTALIFLASLPIILVFIFASDWLILTGFGPQFRDAAPALAILMVGQAVNSYTGVSDVFLNMTMGDKQLAQIIAVAAAVNIVLSMLLTPHLGINGMAIALAASLSIWNVSALVIIRLRNGFWLCWLPGRSLRYSQ